MMQGPTNVKSQLPRYWEAPLFVTATFLTFVVARYMQWGARREILETIRIEFILGLILTVACAFLASASPVNLSGLKPSRDVLIGIVLLFFVMIVQIPFAADKEMANSIFVDRVIKFAMLTFFMVVLIRSPRAMRLFTGAFLFACFYVTQEAARGAIGGGLIWENQGVMRLHGAVPIYAHPNSLGGVAIGLVPFVIFLFPVVRSWKYKLLLLPPLGTAGICMLYSGSRTTYVGFFCFLLFWWFQSRSKLRWILIAAAISLVAFPLLPEQYVERFKSIGGEEAEGHSKEARIVILQDAMVIFLSNPGGVGIASFPAVRMSRFDRKQDTHNLYLEVATNLGIQGLVVFAFLIIVMLRALSIARDQFHKQARELVRALRRTRPDRKTGQLVVSHLDDLRFLKAVSQATSAFIVVRLALGLFGMDLYEVYWWFAAGIAFGVIQLGRFSRRRTQVLVSMLANTSG